MLCPAVVTVAGTAVLARLIAGDWTTVTVAVSGGAVTGPPFGSRPLAVAVFSIRPLSTSACVAVYEAVQVRLPAGGKVVAGQTGVAGGPAGPLNESAIETPAIDTLPRLVTTKL